MIEQLHFILGIDHPALAANNVEKLAKWYCQVLGYREFHKDVKPVRLLIGPDNTILEIMLKDDTPRPSRTTLTSGWSHIAFRVSNLDIAITHLNAHNVTWVSDPKPAIGGGRVRNFHDPEGNLLQILERQFD